MAINVITTGKDVLEGLLGNQLIVIIFFLIVLIIICLLIRLPLSVTFVLCFISTASFLEYGLPIEVFIYELVIMALIMAGYFIKEVLGH